jgi:cell shape-determining protein MreC
MKKATVVIWAIICVLIGIVFYDNWDIISNNISLSIRFVGKPLPPLPIFIYLIIFFFFGFIIAYLFNFSVRFKARRTAKKLNAAITSHKEEVSELKGELNTLKGLETPTVKQTAETKTDTEAVIGRTGDSLVENPADQPAKSSTDKQEANPAEDSKDKSSKKKA